MVPEVNSEPYLKAEFASSRASFSSRVIHDSAEDQLLRQGTPQPYDALAVITAEHPNYSTSTVNLTLTVSDHSSVRSETPSPAHSAAPHESRQSNEPARHDGERKQLSPCSATSSSPFTLDNSTRTNGSGDWFDTSASSMTRSGPQQTTSLVTPTKSKGAAQTIGNGALASAAREESGQKSNMLSPYTEGLNPISKDAVDAWSPSKAFAYTDRKAGLAGAIDSEISHTATESGEEVLSDSFATQTPNDTSGIAAKSPASQRESETGRATNVGAREGDPDTSLESGYTASFTGAAYTTPPKNGRQKTAQARRKERDVKEVSNDIFSVSWSHTAFPK